MHGVCCLFLSRCQPKMGTVRIGYTKATGRQVMLGNSPGNVLEIPRIFLELHEVSVVSHRVESGFPSVPGTPSGLLGHPTILICSLRTLFPTILIC